MDLNLFLLSGGTRVPVHVGAVNGLLDAGARVRAWGGVSAGSLVASVFASGFSAQDAYRLMLETKYERFLDFNLLNIARGMGLSSGRRFEQWLNRFLDGRTFGDLDVPLTVVATDVATGCSFLFSNERTPDVTLAKAVRCSISLPGIFTAPHFDGRQLVDGCFAPVEPHSLFPASTIPSVVVCMDESSVEPRETAGKLSRKRVLLNIIELILRNLKGLHDPELWDQRVRVPVHHTSGLKFRMSDAEKHALFVNGYETAHSKLTKIILESAELRFSERSVLSDDLTETAVAFSLADIVQRDAHAVELAVSG